MWGKKANDNILFCPEMATFILERYKPFFPMSPTILGFLIEDNSIKDTEIVSNGPIEIYFKDINVNNGKVPNTNMKGLHVK